MYINIIKATYNKPTGNIILNREKLKSFSLNSGMRQVSALLMLIQYSIGIPSHSNKARERNKRDSSREGRSQIIPMCV
jgi:hypothetical protein